MSGHRLLFVVACALVDTDRRVLIAQRPEGKQLAGLWEFPGGKVEAGESPLSALSRELTEELGCTISVGPLVTTTVHEYAEIVVELTTYWCTLVHGTPEPHEHQALAWLTPSELPALAWAPADLSAVEIVIATLT